MQRTLIEKMHETGRSCLRILLTLISYKELTKDAVHPPNLDDLFKVQDIEIDKYVVKSYVVLEGYVWDQPLSRRKAPIYLKKEAIIWIRANNKKKEVVDIEYKDGVEFRVATLSWDMYQKLTDHIKKAPNGRRNKKYARRNSN